MLWFFLLIFSGFALLLLGAEGLVRSSARIAKMFGVSSLIIGLTVVAYGTSSPELFMSCYASLIGNTEIAISNVLGSNIFNLLFILGLSSLITPLSVHKQLIKWDIPVMISCSIFLWLIACWSIVISPLEGALFLAAIVFYTFWLIYMSRKETPKKKTLEEDAFSWKSLSLHSSLILISLGLLVAGSDLLIRGAIDLAFFFGISERVVGLTIVAAGTSIPEAVTSIVAALRKEKDIAVGNVIGSNIYNILAVLGVSSCLAPNGLPFKEAALAFDLPFMVIATIICAPLFFSKYQISRLEGAFLILGYGIYIHYLILHP